MVASAVAQKVGCFCDNQVCARELLYLQVMMMMMMMKSATVGQITKTVLQVEDAIY